MSDKPCEEPTKLGAATEPAGGGDDESRASRMTGRKTNLVTIMNSNESLRQLSSGEILSQFAITSTAPQKNEDNNKPTAGAGAGAGGASAPVADASASSAGTSAAGKGGGGIDVLRMKWMICTKDFEQSKWTAMQLEEFKKNGDIVGVIFDQNHITREAAQETVRQWKEKGVDVKHGARVAFDVGADGQPVKPGPEWVRQYAVRLIETRDRVAAAEEKMSKQSKKEQAAEAARQARINKAVLAAAMFGDKP